MNNELIANTSVSWANSEAAGTVKTIDITLPSAPAAQGVYEVMVFNPSAETDLTVKAYNRFTAGGASRDAELKSVSVVKGVGKAELLDGFLLGEGGRITLSNLTAIGLAGAFTAYVQVRKVR
jgi:hypothetical protein